MLRIHFSIKPSTILALSGANLKLDNVLVCASRNSGNFGRVSTLFFNPDDLYKLCGDPQSRRDTENDAHVPPADYAGVCVHTRGQTLHSG